MKNIIKIFVLNFIWITSCDSVETKQNLNFEENFSKYTLNLDQYTSNYVLSSQYLEDYEGQEAFAILNRNLNEIKIYNLLSGNIVDSILFDPEGPYSVGRIYDFFIHNKDSIFLNEKYAYNIHLIDKFGAPKNKYRILPENVKFNKGGIPDSQNTALAEFSIYNPGYIVDNCLIVNTRPDGNLMESQYYESKELGLKIDLKTGNYKYLMSYPDSHKNHIWGVAFSTVYRTYNPDNKTFVYSFPIDERVYTTNDHLSFNNYLFSSKDFKKTRPLSDPTRDPQIYMKYSYMNDSYKQILYDENNKLYYRIGEFKINEDEYVNPTDSYSNLLDIAIIVHDENFERLGEYRIKQPINKAIFPLKAFVNDSGLNIAYVDFENEDKLNFLNLKVQL